MNNGFSSTANGVLFSLSGLNKLEINEQAQIASIGPGRRWGSVYSELSPRGYTVAGGRATNVGVGGLSLGGGISFWIYSHGFGVDNIVSYVVALATGEIREVTAQSDNDLWRALKGSGAPFVLVLEFRYKLIKMPDPTGLVWGGSTVSSGQSLAGVIRETAVFARNALDPKSHLITIIGMVQGAMEAILTIKVYQEPQPQGVVPAVFQGLADVQAPYAAFSDVKNQRIEVISEGQSPQSVQGQRQIMKQLTVSNPDEAFLTKCAEILREELSGPSAQYGATITMGFVPLGPVASSPKDNIMGVSGGKLMSVHYHATWVPAEGDGPIIQGVNTGISRMTQAAKDAGIWNKWVYLNYASADQNPIASYGSQNIALLKRVQARVDPWRRWETLVRGGFKIPR